MTIWQEITTDIEVDLSPRDIMRNLDYNEKEQLLEMLLDDLDYKSEANTISKMLRGKSDDSILTDKKVWDYIIKLIKYDTPDLKEYIIEELQYEPK